MKTFIAAMTLISLAIVSLPAQSQVLQCAERMSSIPDGWLQRSIVELKLEYPNIGFQADDQACQHATDTIKALTKTLGRNYLKGISGYEFAKIINGQEYFTVERFKSRTPKDLQALETALKDNRSHKLKIEANTSYEYFRAGDSIVIMISSATGREDNSKMFRKIQNILSTLVTTQSE